MLSALTVNHLQVQQSSLSASMPSVKNPIKKRRSGICRRPSHVVTHTEKCVQIKDIILWILVTHVAFGMLPLLAALPCNVGIRRNSDHIYISRIQYVMPVPEIRMIPSWLMQIFILVLGVWHLISAYNSFCSLHTNFRSDHLLHVFSN